jgi:hypothetical protein
MSFVYAPYATANLKSAYCARARSDFRWPSVGYSCKCSGCDLALQARAFARALRSKIRLGVTLLERSRCLRGDSHAGESFELECRADDA